MSLTNTENLRDEIDKQFRHYIEGIKIRTKCNLNDGAVNGEGFIRNFLNLLYGFNLHRGRIESAYNETIDLHNLGQEIDSRKICVQITARNDKKKVNKTIDAFKKKKKNEKYNELHFFILDREKQFDYDESALSEFSVKIEFHDYITIFKKLCSLDSYDSIVPVYNFVQQEIGDPNKALFQKKHQPKIKKSSYKNEFNDEHIIDQIHRLLKHFQGLNCIHPRTISELWPFTTGEYGYDTYSQFCLKSDNKEIHEFLEKISVKSHEIELLDECLEPYREKIQEIFVILNHSLIRCICYVEKYTEIKHHKINVLRPNNDCECNYCRFTKFNIRPLVGNLKSKAIKPSDDPNEALSEAYYLFKLGEPVDSWRIFDALTSNLDNPIVKFIAEFNIKNLYGSVNTPWHSDEAKSILPKIEEIDIVNSIYSIDSPVEVRDEIIKIKEDYHLHYSCIEIEKLAEKILKIKSSLSNGYGIFMGPSYVNQLWNELFILKQYYVSNHIVIDSFFKFKNTIKKGIEAVFNSYTTTETFEDRYKEFDEFILNLILEYLSDSDFEKILKDVKPTEIKISNTVKSKILEKIKNYFDFQYHKGAFKTIAFYDILQKQDYFSRFRQDLRQTFNKIMILLLHSNYSTEELKPLSDSILNFIQASEDFNHNNWQYFARFVLKKIEVFSSDQIMLIIDQTLNGRNHRAGEDHLEKICYAASELKTFIITDDRSIEKLLRVATEPCSTCNRLHNKNTALAYWPIFNDKGKELIKHYAVESLLNKFDGQFYQDAALREVITMSSHPNLFNNFIGYVINSCSVNDIKQEKGRWIYRSFTGINALSCLYNMGLNFKDERLSGISSKSEFYNWVITQQNYDYSDFDLQWLTELCVLPFLMENLQEIEALKTKVKDKLKDNYESKLSEFYARYLL